MSWNSIGVPNIPNLPTNIGDAVIKFGGSQAINAFFGNYWGIFDQNGLPLLLVDNVKSVNFKSSSKIAMAPLEAGSFTNYNKVNEPYTVDVLLTKSSGGIQERGAFLALLDAFKNSTDLFMVITPEAIYPNCNIVGYDYAREHNNGARMIKANVHLQEIKEIKPVYDFIETKAPQSSSELKRGNISPAEVTQTNNSSNNASLLYKLKNNIDEKGIIDGLKETINGVLQ